MKTITVESDVPKQFPFVITSGNSKVKIYRVKGVKNEGGFCYQVADYTKRVDAAGNPIRTLISFADFADAKAHATKTAKLHSTGQTIAQKMRDSESTEYGLAVSILKPTGTPLLMAATHYAEAVKLLGDTPVPAAIGRYAEIVKILGDGEKAVEAARFYFSRHRVEDPTMTVSALIDEMISVKMSRKKSDRYVQDLIGRLGRLKADFPGKLLDVDTAQIQKWLDCRRLADGKTPISAQSYNNYRTVIHGLFAFAEARGYIAKGTNPVELVERQTVRGRDVAIFAPTEFAALLNAASPDFLPALAIGGFAGLRSAEIQRLKWSDIDLQRRHITVSAENAKTATRRNFGICDALAAFLSPYAGADGLIWAGTGDDFVNEQRRAARDAGMKWKGNALRHSYASYRMAATQDATKVAYELGNSPAIVHRHYKELVTPEQATAWFGILPTVPANITQLPATA